MARLAWVSLLGLLMGGCVFNRSTPGHHQGPHPSEAGTRDAPADLFPTVDRALPADKRLTDRGQAALIPERQLAVEGLEVPDLPPPPPDEGVDSRAWPDSRGWPDYRAPDVQQPCGPGTCSGCCAGNTCQTALTNEVCGKGGSACVSCSTTGRVCYAGACATCVQSSECSGDTLCINGGCVAAYGRKYNITMVSAVVANKKLDGTNWDLNSYPYYPDPWAQMTVSGGGTSYTYTKWDTFTPTWNQWVSNVTIQKNTAIKITVSDDDGYSSDQIGTFTITVPLSALRTGTLVWKPDDSLYPLKQFDLAFD